MKRKKQIEYEKLGRALQGISHFMRLKILFFLEDGEKTVGEIEHYVRSSQSNISKHLSFMRERDILVSRKEANMVLYSIKNKEIVEILKNFWGLLSNNGTR